MGLEGGDDLGETTSMLIRNLEVLLLLCTHMDHDVLFPHLEKSDSLFTTLTKNLLQSSNYSVAMSTLKVLSAICKSQKGAKIVISYLLKKRVEEGDTKKGMSSPDGEKRTQDYIFEFLDVEDEHGFKIACSLIHNILVHNFSALPPSTTNSSSSTPTKTTSSDNSDHVTEFVVKAIQAIISAGNTPEVLAYIKEWLRFPKLRLFVIQIMEQQVTSLTPFTFTYSSSTALVPWLISHLQTESRVTPVTISAILILDDVFQYSGTYLTKKS